jgi:hypothetical protein
MIRAKCKPVYGTPGRGLLRSEIANKSAEIGAPRCFPGSGVQKLIRAAHAKGETTSRRTRATARIALTCYIRQRAIVCVRTFLPKSRVWSFPDRTKPMHTDTAGLGSGT